MSFYSLTLFTKSIFNSFTTMLHKLKYLVLSRFLKKYQSENSILLLIKIMDIRVIHKPVSVYKYKSSYVYKKIMLQLMLDYLKFDFIKLATSAQIGHLSYEIEYSPNECSEVGNSITYDKTCCIHHFQYLSLY